MIETERLELIPASATTTRAALEDNREQLGALLHADVPESWPPELLDPPIGVMEKCGFRFTGGGSEPGVNRYEITRTQISQRH